MKHRFFLILMMVCCFSAVSFTANAGAKQDKRVAYVLQQLNLKADAAKKLKPMLVKYLTDKKEAGEAYNDLKDKYKSAIKSNTLTERQANQLLQEKWAADQKELTVKRTYTGKFKTVLTARQTYRCFDLLNDKMSKVEGKKETADDDDDE